LFFHDLGRGRGIVSVYKHDHILHGGRRRGNIKRRGRNRKIEMLALRVRERGMGARALTPMT